MSVVWPDETMAASSDLLRLLAGQADGGGAVGRDGEVEDELVAFAPDD